VVEIAIYSALNIENLSLDTSRMVGMIVRTVSDVEIQTNFGSQLQREVYTGVFCLEDGV
jgi:hypothetical protein